MTLQNGAVHGGEVRLWTDTAYLDASTGKIACFDSKAFEGLFWPFAGALSLVGPTTAAYDIPAAIGAAYPASVDELLDVTSKALLAYAGKGGFGRVLIGAWEDGPRLFVIATDGAGLVAPFEPAELDFYCSSGNPDLAGLVNVLVRQANVGDRNRFRIRSGFCIVRGLDLAPRY